MLAPEENIFKRLNKWTIGAVGAFRSMPFDWRLVGIGRHESIRTKK